MSDLAAESMEVVVARERKSKKKSKDIHRSTELAAQNQSLLRCDWSTRKPSGMLAWLNSLDFRKGTWDWSSMSIPGV